MDGLYYGVFVNGDNILENLSRRCQVHRFRIYIIKLELFSVKISNALFGPICIFLDKDKIELSYRN